MLLHRRIRVRLAAGLIALIALLACAGGADANWSSRRAATGASALAIIAAVAALHRRGRSRGLAPLSMLDKQMRSAHRDGRPLGLISVTADDPAAARRLAPVLRARLREGDRLAAVDAARLLVIAPGTDPQTAAALASDLRRTLLRAPDGPEWARIAVHDHRAHRDAGELALALAAERD
jgi:hypothetical protein